MRIDKFEYVIDEIDEMTSAWDRMDERNFINPRSRYRNFLITCAIVAFSLPLLPLISFLLWGGV